MNKPHQPHQSIPNQPAPDSVQDRTQQKRDQEALRQSEKKHRRLFETMDTGFAVGEAMRDERGKMVNYRLTQINPAFEKLTGLDPNKAVGKPILDVLPGLDAWWLATYQQVVDSGQTVHVEEFLPQLNRWYGVTAFYYGEEQFAAYYNDITERKRQQAHLAFLAEVSQDLVGLTTIDETMNALSAKIGGYFKASRCAFFEFNETRDEQGGLAAVYEYDWHRAGVPNLGGSYRTDEFLQSMRVGEAFVLRDREADSRVNAKSLAALHIASLIGIPIVTNQPSLFVLCIYDMVSRNWHEDEIELMRELTTRIRTRLERAKAEAALHESQKRFESIANLVPDLLWDSAPDGSTNWYNQRWLAYTGQRFEEAIGWGWTEAIHPDDREASAKRYGEAVDLGQSLRQEHRIRRHDGAYRWFVVSTSPLKDQTGQVVKMYGAAIDIHESKLAEEALRQSEEQYRQLSAHLEEQIQERTQELEISVEELKRSNENLEQFAYIASHDLQEPLRKIQQFGDLLHGQYQEALGDGTAYLTRMQVAASRMSVLIKDLLTFSRIATTQAVAQPVFLTDVVSQVIESLSVAIEESGAQLKVDDLPIVEGDSLQLTQLFQNLMSNALKFRRTDSTGTFLRPQIAVRAQLLTKDDLPASVKPTRDADYYHRIEVLDNGIGFDEKYLDRIFQVFQRLHGKNEFAGTGVGLAIVQKVVTNHGGAITAISKLNQGATFCVYLPA